MVSLIDAFVTKFIGVGQNRCNQKHENEIVSNNEGTDPFVTTRDLINLLETVFRSPNIGWTYLLKSFFHPTKYINICNKYNNICRKTIYMTTKSEID